MSDENTQDQNVAPVADDAAQAAPAATPAEGEAAAPAAEAPEATPAEGGEATA